MPTVTFSIPSELAAQLPTTAEAQRRVIELGIRHWKIERALDEYAGSRCTLARAAEIAGVTLREMIPLALAAGLEPEVDAEHVDRALSLDEAAKLL